MDFLWTTEQQNLYDNVAEFACSELTDNIVQRDHESVFSDQLWKRCSKFGVLGWAAPETYGGQGHSITTVTYLMEALGYGCQDNGLLFALGTQIWGIQQTLFRFGTEEQKETYLSRIISGKALAAFAINEPDSGSDALSLKTTAILDNDAYVLNGEKVLVTLSPLAGFALVFAVTDVSAGRWGISAFIVDSTTPGFIANKGNQQMGLRTAPVGSVTLDQCRVPRTALLGKLGAGASIFNFTQKWERSLILAPQLGAMQRILEERVEFVKTRHRAQQPIGKYQAVSHRIADMKVRLEASRLLLYKTAFLLENDRDCIMDAAITKLYLSESFVEFCKDAIVISGGTGYATDSGIERHLRDALGNTIYGGTSDMQKNIIASLLGL